MQFRPHYNSNGAKKFGEDVGGIIKKYIDNSGSLEKCEVCFDEDIMEVLMTIDDIGIGDVTYGWKYLCDECYKEEAIRINEYYKGNDWD